MVLRIFPVALYFIYNKWLYACWIHPLHTTFSHPEQEFIAPKSFDVTIRLQLMTLESTSIANKTKLQRKYLMHISWLPIQMFPLHPQTSVIFYMAFQAVLSFLCKVGLILATTLALSRDTSFVLSFLLCHKHDNKLAPQVSDLYFLASLTWEFKQAVITHVFYMGKNTCPAKYWLQGRLSWKSKTISWKRLEIIALWQCSHKTFALMI